MSCKSCGRTSAQMAALLLRTHVARNPSGVLSAPTLSPRGWVSTCVVCGTQTEPAKFPEGVEQKCSCVR
jgi:hypothetical protein